MRTGTPIYLSRLVSLSSSLSPSLLCRPNPRRRRLRPIQPASSRSKSNSPTPKIMQQQRSVNPSSSHLPPRCRRPCATLLSSELLPSQPHPITPQGDKAPKIIAATTVGCCSRAPPNPIVPAQPRCIRSDSDMRQHQHVIFKNRVFYNILISNSDIRFEY